MSYKLTPLFTDESRRARPALGTVVRVRIEEPPSPQTETALQEAFACCERLETVFSKFDPSSDVSRFNSSPARPFSPEFQELLVLAQRIERESQGAFTLRPDGSSLDLSGIAKGFIADRMAAVLAGSLGDVRAQINAGGDIRFTGQAPYLAHVRVSEGALRPLESSWPAIATSSLSESLSNPDSTTVYPRPLRPGLSAEHSVTVLAFSCAIADALTKVALFGTPETVDHCARLYDTRILIFNSEGEVIESFG